VEAGNENDFILVDKVVQRDPRVCAMFFDLILVCVSCSQHRSK
jgi:hypothetical protein